MEGDRYFCESDMMREFAISGCCQLFAAFASSTKAIKGLVKVSLLQGLEVAFGKEENACYVMWVGLLMSCRVLVCLRLCIRR